MPRALPVPAVFWQYVANDQIDEQWLFTIQTQEEGASRKPNALAQPVAHTVTATGGRLLRRACFGQRVEHNLLRLIGAEGGVEAFNHDRTVGIAGRKDRQYRHMRLPYQGGQ